MLLEVATRPLRYVRPAYRNQYREAPALVTEIPLILFPQSTSVLKVIDTHHIGCSRSVG